MKLTVLDKEFEAKRKLTKPGMAFWAGTGPKGKTCRSCRNYQDRWYFSANSKNGETLKPSPCAKYRELTNRQGKAIPHDTPACQYYDENPTPPSVTRPQKAR